MDFKKCCIWCVKPLDDPVEDFHPECWTEAKKHLDAVVDMARRKYGYGFDLRIFTSPCGDPEVVNLGDGEAPGVRTFGMEAAVPPEKRECLCERDADGRCPSCTAVMSDNFGRMIRMAVESHRRTVQFQKTCADVCGACGNEHMDFTFAKAAREFMAVMRETDSVGFLPVLSDVLLMMRQMVPGVKSWPLLEKEIRDAMGDGRDSAG